MKYRNREKSGEENKLTIYCKKNKRQKTKQDVLRTFQCYYKRTYVFECVAIPANALYHANAAAVIPQAPPALIRLMRGSLFSRAR